MVLTNGGASVRYFNINLSGRYRIANVICMVNFNLQFPLEKEGQ
mgnify:CR=1 FL=1